MDDSIKKTGQAGTNDALVREVARMISEWEEGDELATELAERVVRHVLSWPLSNDSMASSSVLKSRDEMAAAQRPAKPTRS